MLHIRIFLLLGFFFLQNLSIAQTNKAINISLKQGEVYSFSLEESELFAFTAVSLNILGGVSDLSTYIRSRSAEADWTAWEILPESEFGTARNRLFGQVYVSAPHRFFEIKIKRNLEQAINTTRWSQLPVHGTLHVYSPTEFRGKEKRGVVSLLQASKTPRTLTYQSGQFCPQPAYIDRAGWGGSPNQQSGCTPTLTTVSHLIVHHEASTPVPPYAAAVKSIWQFHTGINGWCDIAYNWLIAPDGVLYEGRAGGDNVLGAHFCGSNQGTMGICLLGNFETDIPTDAALETLTKLLAWKASQEGIDPDSISPHSASGKQLPHISGHRLGCATLCPGKNLFDSLASVQNRVSLLYNDPTGCDGIYPPINDACTDAILLHSAATCTYTTADVEGASSSGIAIPTCSGFNSPSAMDVWFRFTAVSSHENIAVRPNSTNLAGLDPVIALYEGTCGNLTLVDCNDAVGGAGGMGTLNLTNLTIGTDYWIRVFDFGSTPPSDPVFEICVQHQAVSNTNTISNNSRIQLFPNPSKTAFTLNFEQLSGAPSSVHIFDALGRIVFSKKEILSNDLQIDCSTWASGLYRVQVLNGQGTIQNISLAKE